MPRWDKGHSGNPRGRPKHDHTFTDTLRAQGPCYRLLFRISLWRAPVKLVLRVVTRKMAVAVLRMSMHPAGPSGCADST